MPMFQFSQALTANQKGYNPLQGWQYEYVPYPAYVRVGTRTTGAAGNVTEQVFSGSNNIKQKSPMQVGGTAGVTPSPLNTPFLEFVAMPGDRISLSIDENAGATPTVDGVVYIDPA